MNKRRKLLVTPAEDIVVQLHIKKKSIDILNIRLLCLEVPKQLQIMKGGLKPTKPDQLHQ